MSKKYLITSDDTAELWEGTQAEFTTESADIPNGTLVVINDDLPTGELIDKTLDTTSENAISNKAVATAVNSINQNLANDYQKTKTYKHLVSGVDCTTKWGNLYITPKQTLTLPDTIPLGSAKDVQITYFASFGSAFLMLEGISGNNIQFYLARGNDQTGLNGNMYIKVTY